MKAISSRYSPNMPSHINLQNAAFPLNSLPRSQEDARQHVKEFKNSILTNAEYYANLDEVEGIDEHLGIVGDVKVSTEQIWLSSDDSVSLQTNTAEVKFDPQSREIKRAKMHCFKGTVDSDNVTETVESRRFIQPFPGGPIYSEVQSVKKDNRLLADQEQFVSVEGREQRYSATRVLGSPLQERQDIEYLIAE